MFPREDPFNFGGDSFFKGFHEAFVAQHRKMHEEFTNAVRRNEAMMGHHHQPVRSHPRYQSVTTQRQHHQERKPFPVLEYSSGNNHTTCQRPPLRSSSSSSSSSRVQLTGNTLKREGILPVVNSSRSSANNKRKEKESSNSLKKSPLPQKQRQQKPSSSQVNARNQRSTNTSSVINPPLSPPSPSAKSENGEEKSNSVTALVVEKTKQQVTVSEVFSILESKFEPIILNSVCGDIITCKTTFGDIASLDEPKRILHEAIMLPLLIPELFVGIREPWKGVLLFGPPGTGKTLLAKAVAGSKSTFFNMSSASLIHKYRGESEKVLKCLFEVAKLMNPSVIFFDEIDAIASSRGDASEHEASRRLKSELLSQMDGVGGSSGENENKRVVILATTNTPWDIDAAMLRRLEKRIYIPLPEEEGRKQHLQLLLKDVSADENIDIDDIVKRTRGYSGADLHLMAREALMGPMRRHLAGLTAEDIDEKRNNGTLDNEILMKVPPVTHDDFIESLVRVKASVDGSSLQNFVEWDRQFGSK